MAKDSVSLRNVRNLKWLSYIFNVVYEIKPESEMK